MESDGTARYPILLAPSLVPHTALGVPHTATEDDVYEGYFIPKGR